MMRTYILFSAVCVLALACTKTASNSNTGNPGLAITITGVSPKIFYVDEQITITGTGFNPDKTKDTIDFGAIDSSTSPFQFYANPYNSYEDYTIVSASPTELVIKAARPDSLYQRIYPSPIFNEGIPNGTFRIRSEGSSAYSRPVGFKEFPWIGTNGDFTYAYTPGDSVEVYVAGF